MSLSPIQRTLESHVFENERRQDPMGLLPKDVMMKIFSYLQPQELGKCCRVSRGWKVLASDDHLWEAMYPAIAFGRKEWETYFGDVGEEPPLPPDIHRILQSPCPFWPDKKVQETHLLVLIPKTVNGEPLTLTSLEELVEMPKQGNKTQYRDFDLGEYTDRPAPASHWVLMTRDVLPASRKQRYTDQQALVASYAQKTKTPYQVPNILDAMVCIFLEYIRSGTRLYSDNSRTYTRCQEKYDAKRQLVVGGFAADGLDVKYDGCLFGARSRHGGIDARYGVGALWKF